MYWYNLVGIILSLISMFSGFVAILLFFKVRKFVSQIPEDQFEPYIPFVQKQYKKIKTFLLMCLILGVVGLILTIIWGIFYPSYLLFYSFKRTFFKSWYLCLWNANFLCYFTLCFSCIKAHINNFFLSLV